MQILNCTPDDAPAVLALYEAARQLQTAKKRVVWPVFAQKLVENEIANAQQFKIVINGEIACNWAVTFTDEYIWEEKEQGDAIYIHRIATNPNCRGNNFVEKIVDWARKYAADHNRKHVRLDTLGNNTALIEHYTQAGFTFLGIFHLENTAKLPAHYQNEKDCCLFEIVL